MPHADASKRTNVGKIAQEILFLDKLGIKSGRAVPLAGNFILDKLG